MRHFLATFLALLGLGLPAVASVDFSGTWLDLKASDSPAPMLKRMKASALERKFADSTQDGKNAELTVTRKLADGGNSLVLSQRLKIEGEPPQPVVRRIWRKKA
jgi:hypothetical protein